MFGLLLVAGLAVGAYLATRHDMKKRKERKNNQITDNYNDEKNEDANVSKFNEKIERPLDIKSDEDHKKSESKESEKNETEIGEIEKSEKNKFNEKGENEKSEIIKFNEKGENEKSEKNKFDDKGENEKSEKNKFDEKGENEKNEINKFNEKGENEKNKSNENEKNKSDDKNEILKHKKTSFEESESDDDDHKTKKKQESISKKSDDSKINENIKKQNLLDDDINPKGDLNLSTEEKDIVTDNLLIYSEAGKGFLSYKHGTNGEVLEVSKEDKNPQPFYFKKANTDNAVFLSLRRVLFNINFTYQVLDVSWANNKLTSWSFHGGINQMFNFEAIDRCSVAIKVNDKCIFYNESTNDFDSKHCPLQFSDPSFSFKLYYDTNEDEKDKKTKREYDSISVNQLTKLISIL